MKREGGSIVTKERIRTSGRKWSERKGGRKLKRRMCNAQKKTDYLAHIHIFRRSFNQIPWFYSLDVAISNT